MKRWWNRQVTKISFGIIALLSVFVSKHDVVGIVRSFPRFSKLALIVLFGIGLDYVGTLRFSDRITASVVGNMHRLCQTPLEHAFQLDCTKFTCLFIFVIKFLIVLASCCHRVGLHLWTLYASGTIPHFEFVVLRAFIQKVN